MTSDDLTSRQKSSRPCGRFRSSRMLCFPRFDSKWMRKKSSPGGSTRSILVTSAPSSASVRPHVGPASTMQRSSTRTPSRAPRGSGSAGAAARSDAGSSSSASSSSRSASSARCGPRISPGLPARCTSGPGCAIGPRRGSSTLITAAEARACGCAIHSAVVRQTAAATPAPAISPSHSSAGRAAKSAVMRSISSAVSSGWPWSESPGSPLSLGSASQSETPTASARARIARVLRAVNCSQRPSAQR